MAVTVSKIRLGAPSQLLVGSQDMGATKGGMIFRYAPTQMLIECDQFLAPVATFRTKEECDVSTAFYETHMVKITNILGLQGQGNVVTTTGTPNTDKFNFGGQVIVSTATFDATIPKNDSANTTTNMLLHLNKVHGYKELSWEAARDKDATYKGTFNALADTTQAAGQQLGYFTEQY